jgi:hypothetical protein
VGYSDRRKNGFVEEFFENIVFIMSTFSYSLPKKELFDGTNIGN